MLITAATITDEQIRELRDVAADHGVTIVCRAALSRQLPPRFDTRENARARCAAIINDAFAAASDADVDAVWKLGAQEGIHGNPDVLHVATVAKNVHRDFSIIDQAFARTRCAEILEGTRARAAEGK